MALNQVEQYCLSGHEDMGFQWTHRNKATSWKGSISLIFTRSTAFGEFLPMLTVSLAGLENIRSVYAIWMRLNRLAALW